jgi:hypothetical protein
MTNTLQSLELGYYQVGATAYGSKVQALIEATKTNQYPTWNFNNQVFDKYNWSVEPMESLETLYARRAQQLRDKYDYIILLYSGGSDSQTVLDSFLNQGLQVDEIITIYPESLSNLYTPNANNFDPLNILSEWDFVIKPKLQELAQKHPKIKITIYDWGKNVPDRVDDDYVLKRGHNITPYYHSRCNFYDIPSVADTIEKIDKVGLILGVDKPRICFHENAYRLYFLDILLAQFGAQNDLEHRRNRKLNSELFYWSPDSCDMLAKQAHILVKFFELSPGFKTYIQWPNKNPAHRTWYESSVKSLIYPNYDLSLFQANKMTDMTLGYDRLLFMLGKEDEIRGLLRNSLDYLYDHIDEKFFNIINGTKVFTGFINGMWPIKTVQDQG